jgi:quercetin 2,3-dioxygenase
MTINLRPSAARGHAELGWLSTRHSFSFAHYYDPRFMGFRSLRVINEDVIQGATGFGTHGHHDMEILTYIVEGALEHRDSTGDGAVIRRGEVQRMTAGAGIRHSEYNASPRNPVKLLQIWLLPDRDGLPPGYEQKLFPEGAKKDRLCLLASPDGRDGSLSIHQDAFVYASLLEKGREVSLPLASGRGAWVQVVAGKVSVNGRSLTAGDGASVEQAEAVRLAAETDSEFLLFDLG